MMGLALIFIGGCNNEESNNTLDVEENVEVFNSSLTEAEEIYFNSLELIMAEFGNEVTSFSHLIGELSENNSLSQDKEWISNIETSSNNIIVLRVILETEELIQVPESMISLHNNAIDALEAVEKANEYIVGGIKTIDNDLLSKGADMLEEGTEKSYLVRELMNEARGNQ